MRQLVAGIIITWGLHLGVHPFVYANGGPYGAPQRGVIGHTTGKILPHPWLKVTW